MNFNKDEHAEVIKAIKAYKNLKAKMAEMEKEADALKAVIITAMGANDTATCKAGGVSLTVTNKQVTTTRIDTKKVKEFYPAVAAECSTTSTSPRFTVK